MLEKKTPEKGAICTDASGAGVRPKSYSYKGKNTAVRLLKRSLAKNSREQCFERSDSNAGKNSAAKVTERDLQQSPPPALAVTSKVTKERSAQTP